MLIEPGDSIETLKLHYDPEHAIFHEGVVVPHSFDKLLLALQTPLDVDFVTTFSFFFFRNMKV